MESGEAEVNIYLNETGTIFLFQQQSSTASYAGPEAESIQKENEAYRSYQSSSSTDRGNYTFHLFTKEKESQTEEVIKNSVDIQLDLHQLKTTDIKFSNNPEKNPVELLRDSFHPLASNEWQIIPETMLKDDSVKIDFGPNSRESDQILHQYKNFGHSLFVVERMVQQNIHLEKLLNYSSPNSTTDQPSVEMLLKFHCGATFLRPIKDISFNMHSYNFFAVAYGECPEPSQTKFKSPGMICVWNILNPGQPERIIETSSIPTSIVFSEGVPYLIAAGFSDGAVGLFDIRQKKCECIAMSTVESGSHEGEVGEVVFQQRTDTRVRSEAVVSVANGGRVTQWTVANGLEHKDMVTLKKLKTVVKEGETQTLRYEDLHCISFNISQPNIYVVGSEDGAIFVCDTQYNEDYLQKLLFHFRSVLTVRFSPIAPGWFLSGSCDGSAALWTTQKTSPIAVFYLGKATFNSISWSPISGTVFAAACSDGECRVWDVSLDSVDPVAKLTTYEKKEFTAVSWSPKLPIFVCGNSSGVVYLSKVHGLASLTAGRSLEEERARFESVIQMMSNQE